MNWTPAALKEFLNRWARYVPVIGSSQGQLNIAASSVKMDNIPAFHAYNTGTDLNVTGDGTNYTVQFNAELYDQGNDFASNTFTAPVDGRYLFTTCLYLTTATRDKEAVRLRLVSSNRTHRINSHVDSSAYLWTELTFGGSLILDMDEGDTVYVELHASGGTKDVNVIGDSGSGGNETVFMGVMVA